MNKSKIYVIDFMIIAVLLLFDQFTKFLAVQNLKDAAAFVLIKNVLEFDYLENPGVAFGMLQNHGTLFILVTTLILLLFVLYFMYRIPADKKYTILHVIFSAIIAGGIGNIIDRVRLGYVIDFISFVLIDFPTFNVADCYIVCATFTLFFVSVFVMKEEDLDFISFKKAKEN